MTGNRVDDALATNEAVLATSFKNSPLPMLILGRTMEVLDMNLAAEAVFAGSDETVKGREMGNPVHCASSMQHTGGCGGGQSCMTCPIRRLVADTFQTGVTHHQVETKLAGGSDPRQSERYLLLSTARSDSPAGRHVVVCIEDMTKRKLAELNLQQALREIEQLKECLQLENAYLRDAIELCHDHEGIIGQSRAIKTVLGQVEQVAKTPATVLIQGETGVGKELVAWAIHRSSTRKDKPMVTVNCAALPATLVESELFGREAGAYTGASSEEIGRFELADASTIFLDEIGELSLDIQAKLLRILENGKFERLGSSKTRKCNVRVIAATNRDLATCVQRGEFRADLYYRLNIFPIQIPPLRDRPEDIPLLVHRFVGEFAAAMSKQIDKISTSSLKDLQRYPWPGNVRELRNIIERAVILSPDGALRFHLPNPSDIATDQDHTDLEAVQRAHILKVLNRIGWRIRGEAGAAQLLGLKPSTLESKMAKLGIRRHR